MDQKFGREFPPLKQIKKEKLIEKMRLDKEGYRRAAMLAWTDMIMLKRDKPKNPLGKEPETLHEARIMAGRLHISESELEQAALLTYANQNDYEIIDIKK